MEAQLSRSSSPSLPTSASLPSTTEARKPLRALVGTWAKLANQPFDACWNQLKAAFQLSTIKDLPADWIPDALAWVQAKIDSLPKALPEEELRITQTQRAVCERRIAELKALEERWASFAQHVLHTLNGFAHEFVRISAGSNTELLRMACPHVNVSLDGVLGVMNMPSYNAQTWVDAGLSEMRVAIRAAITANRLMERA